jgi:hypothetical protein
MIIISQIKNAVRENNIPLLKRLMKDNTLPYSNFDDILLYPCNNGFYEVVVLFLEHYKDTEFTQSEMLEVASQNNHLKIVELLLGHQNYIIENLNYPFLYACENNHYTVAAKIMETKNINFEEIGFRGIHHAVKNNNIKLLLLMLNDDTHKYYTNIDKNTLDNEGFSNAVKLLRILEESFCLAALYHFKDILNLLINHKMLAKSDYISDSLAKATIYPDINTINLLLSFPIIDPTFSKCKAMSFAYRNKHKEIIKFLWNDKRVKKALKNDQPEIHKNLSLKTNINNF